MKFVITDASQYASGKKDLSPEYIDKLKDKYKLETIKTKTIFGKFVIGLDLSLPEEIESIVDSTIVIYDSYLE